MNRQRGQSRVSKWGWGILLAFSILLVINGVSWFFSGPSLSWIEGTGVSLDEFRQAYPNIATAMAVNARQVAIWFIMFGLLGLLVALEGYRNGSRWAWRATWLVVAAPTAIGILYRDGFGVYILGLAAIALIGQLLAGRGLSAEANQAV